MADIVSAQKIVRALRGAFIHFPHVVSAHARMNAMRESEPSIEEPDNLLIIGPPGVGKSRLLKTYAAQFPPIKHDWGTEVSVLYCPIPSKCNIGDLAGLMLHELGDPLWMKGKEADRTTRLVKLLKKCKDRMVLLDEINHLVDRGGEKTHYAVGDWIKALNDATAIPFVLAGTPRGRQLLLANDQLMDRFRETIELAPFSMQEAASENLFRSAILAFKELMSGIPSIDLTQPTIARQLIFATGGRLRSIRRLLVRTVEVAFKMEKPAVTISTLSTAFISVIYQNAPDNRNPFHKRFSGTPLIQAGEPFAPGSR